MPPNGGCETGFQPAWETGQSIPGAFGQYSGTGTSPGRLRPDARNARPGAGIVSWLILLMRRHGRAASSSPGRLWPNAGNAGTISGKPGSDAGNVWTDARKSGHNARNAGTNARTDESSPGRNAISRILCAAIWLSSCVPFGPGRTELRRRPQTSQT